MGSKAIIFLCALVVLASCSKTPPETVIIADKVSVLPNAGLISDFELYDPPPGAVHIDPDNSNDPNKDGSIDHPYSSFDEINWEDGMVYALKRGTVLNSKQITISGNHITLASYGEGPRPIIHCTDKTTNSGNKYGILSYWEGISHVTIRDIEITAPDATSCISFHNNCENISVINCKLHNSAWGLRSYGNIGLYVYNTEIFNTKDDGIFIQYDMDIEIRNCYIHKVNTNWKAPATSEQIAAGDGIQLDECNNWHVHHNTIDRTGSGNKACFISNNEDQDKGILEYNILRGPSVNGACAYFHNGRDIIIRYNYMDNTEGSPIYTHGDDFIIHHNIFYKNESPVFTSSTAKIYNNLFYRMPLCIYGGQVEVSNNIFDSEEGNFVLRYDKLTGSNNLFVNNEPVKGSFWGSPVYVDEENKNFRLQKGSDGIDMGLLISILKHDMDSISIPQGSKPDVGPYEHH